MAAFRRALHERVIGATVGGGSGLIGLTERVEALGRLPAAQPVRCWQQPRLRSVVPSSSASCAIAEASS